MATATLRALRDLHPQARITCMARSYVSPLIDAMPWFDDLIVTHSPGDPDHESLWRLARRLRRERFDLAVLLPNSFRTALLVRLARIPRRIGYARDGRGFLLTDQLQPQREAGRFVPTPALGYYLDLARRLGASSPDATMQLFTRPEQDEQVDAIWRDAGIRSDRPVVLLNPGARYGDAKMWIPERFAAVGDQLIDDWNATVLLSGAPNEQPILDAVQAAARHPLIELPSHNVGLGMLKSVMRRCDLVITNDTGPRHIAAAFGVPVITVFGPTDPRWTEIDFSDERIVRIDVDCGPCQKKICPLDHRCMTRVTPDMVTAHAKTLLSARAGNIAEPARRLDNPRDP